MRTEWTLWDLNDMIGAAELEDRVTLGGLGTRELLLTESLPYFGGFADYSHHVTGCIDCRRDDREDCARGEGLLELSRIGVEEQHRAAVNN